MTDFLGSPLPNSLCPCPTLTKQVWVEVTRIIDYYCEVLKLSVSNITCVYLLIGQENDASRKLFF